MNKKIIEPGTYIAAGEELAQGKGTYAHNDEIYSALYGVNESTEREAKVACKKVIRGVNEGDDVYGIITDTMESKALVLITPSLERNERSLPQDIFVIKVSSIDNSYVKQVNEVLRRGDIIKAKVVGFRGELELNTKDPKYGVVKAFCTHCRKPMVLKESKLICKGCGSVSRRKISSEYLIKE